MAIPTYDRLVEPLLRLLGERDDGLSMGEGEAELASRLGLSAAERAQLLPTGGQTLFRNRIGWAHDRLKRAGLSASVRRGHWQITPAGRTYLAARTRPFTHEEVAAIVAVPRAGGGAPGLPPGSAPVPAVVPAMAPLGPEEQIEAALQEMRDSVAAQLLEAIRSKPPAFFESVVLDLLHAMGYGESRADLQRVGRSGDGGIDGVIALDRLGLEMVYVQAKRYSDNTKVGRPAVQAFCGALVGRRASKGVMITSGPCTAEAVEYAATIEGRRLVLIDGERLAQLMIDHAVGVSNRVLQVPRFDSDYFDDA